VTTAAPSAPRSSGSSGEVSRPTGGPGGEKRREPNEQQIIDSLIYRRDDFAEAIGILGGAAIDFDRHVIGTIPLRRRRASAGSST
jgi:hypothetical protein